MLSGWFDLFGYQDVAGYVPTWNACIAEDKYPCTITLTICDIVK